MLRKAWLIGALATLFLAIHGRVLLTDDETFPQVVVLKLNRLFPTAPTSGSAASSLFRLCGWSVCGLALGLFPFQLRGNDSASELRDFSVRTWSAADGLPAGSVTVVQQTEDGYLWVGTTAGLVRFDGLRFTKVDLSAFAKDVGITSLCEDKSGQIWIGTENRGLFSWKDGQVRRYGVADGLLDEGVTSLTLDAAGALWIGTKAGVNRRDTDHWTAFTTKDGLPGNYVSSVHAARSGAVWITTAQGMCRFIGGHLKPFEFPAVGQERQDEFLGAYEDRRGNLWAFCATYLINLAEGKRINYFPGEKSAMTRIWSLCEGRNGRLWIAASGRGVFCFDGTRFQPVTLAEGRWPNDVRTICEDHEGSIWLGISDGVLVQLRPQRFAVLTSGHGLPAGAATCLTVDPLGRVSVGMDAGGLYTSIGDHFEKVSEETKWLAQEPVCSACVGLDGSLWAGTAGGGLFEIKEGRTIVYTTANGLSDDCVLAVCTDSHGAIWAGTRAGTLHCVKDGRISSITEGLPGSSLTSLLPAAGGGLWIGTEDGSLIRADDSFQNVRTEKLSPNLSGKAILGLCEGQHQTLWIASAGGGLGCLTKDGCLSWDSRDGLVDDVVSAVIEDSEANLWLDSPRGLCRVDSNSVASVLEGHGRFKPKLLLDSTPGSDRSSNFGWPRAVRSTGGRLWFATTSGLIAVDTRGWEAEKPAPQVHLESVYVNSALAHVADKGEGGATFSQVRLPANLKSLEFQVAALSFEAPEKIRYRHKLDGFDAGWVETGPDRHVGYRGLPSASYVFHATACNPEGVWNEQGVSFAFVIPTPLWRTPWAFAFYGLAVTTLAAGVVRLVSHRRLQRRLVGLEQQQAMERERMRIARNMHDEIGSKLTKISFLSERLKVESGQPGPMGDKVESIAHTSRDLLKALDEMVWAVNPHNDTLEQLVSYLCHHAREYFNDTPVECHLQVQSELPSIPVSAEFRHNVFLAFEESLSNILKHSQATRVDIQIEVKEETLQIHIADNGVGFAAVAHNGNGVGRGRSGLKNMKQHLADVGGYCGVESRPGRGANVNLSVALNSLKVRAV